MTQFYIFKSSAKQNLNSIVFDKLKEFLETADTKLEPTITSTSNKFILAYGGSTIEPEIAEYHSETGVYEVETIEDDACNDDEGMTVEDDEEPYFVVEDLTEECESETIFADDPEVIFLKAETTGSPQRSSKGKMYQCDCGKGFSSMSLLEKHSLQHKRRTMKGFVCCDVGFKEQKYGEIHEKAHENFEAIAPNLASYGCNRCRVFYSHEEDLVLHMSHHLDPNFLVENFLVPRPSAYEDHMIKTSLKVEDAEVDDDNKDFFSCGHCAKKLNDFDMKIHLLFFHTQTVFCPLDNRCFEGMKQVRLFSDHIRNKHPEVFEKNDLYNCRHCNLSFSSNFEKLAHMKKCDAKLFACENHCDKRFATEWLLKNHIKLVMGEDRFSCDICGKKCVSRSDLQIHNRSHTNERPYSCPICNRSFKTSANRSSHLDIHEQVKRHECDVCGELMHRKSVEWNNIGQFITCLGEKFQTRPILRKHKKKHDTKYQDECVCRICNRKYISKPHLLRHLKSSHSSPQDLSTDGMKAFFEDFLSTQETE